MMKTFNLKKIGVIVIFLFFLMIPFSVNAYTRRVDPGYVEELKNTIVPALEAKAEPIPRNMGIKITTKKRVVVERLVVVVSKSTDTSAKLAYEFEGIDVNRWLCRTQNNNYYQDRCIIQASNDASKEHWIKMLAADRVRKKSNNDPIENDEVFIMFNRGYDIATYNIVLRSASNPNERVFLGAESFEPLVDDGNFWTTTWDTETEGIKGAINSLKAQAEEIKKKNQSSQINCGVSHTPGSFEYEFCNAYNATPAENRYNLTEGQTMDLKTFKCDPYNFSKPDDVSDYYVNKSYMVGTSSTTGPIYDNGVPLVYTFHYHNNGGPAAETVTLQCNKTCVETVTVEYGPPVGIKAGFGFEYKVKMTSRVNCYSTSPIKEPEIEVRYKTVCTPAPICVHSKGAEIETAGPNEEFDQCIKNCDGGKYTQKCSLSCYNEVYGTKSEISKSLANSFYDDYLEKVKNNKESCDNKVTSKAGTKCRITKWCPASTDGVGSYSRYTDASGVYVVWNFGNQYCPGLGRYYVMKGNVRSELKCVKNTGKAAGIASECDCTVACHWDGCTGETMDDSKIYINPIDTANDMKANYETYVRALGLCGNSNTCKTEEAYFNISTNYLASKSNQEFTVNFPYTRTSDVLKFKNPQKCDNPANGSTTTADNWKDTSIISCAGCYNVDNDTNWYHAEWGFPGTWINGKTGELAYSNPNSTGKAWGFRKHKFYVPRDAQDVNQKWWLYYYTKLYGNDSNYAANSTNKVNSSSCDKCNNYKVEEFSSTDVSELKYNIKATSRNFGHFGWNVDISCFYSLYSKLPSCSIEEEKCTIPDIPTYKVRSVDLNNMFPDKEGTSKSDEIHSPVPFNWSSFSTSTKDSSYISNAVAYRKWVEENNYNIYSDKYLDYKIKLDRNTIRQIRNSGNSIGQYNGNIIDNDHVNIYRSSLFATGGILANNGSIYPSSAALKCNNIKNRSSGECEKF